MAIRCSACGREYDVTLFPFGATIRCDCGERVSALAAHRAAGGPGEGAPPAPDLRRRGSRRKMEELGRGADRIASMILYGRDQYAEVDVDIAIERLRERAEEMFPGRSRLFEMVYEARFERLREQWGAY